MPSLERFLIGFLRLRNPSALELFPTMTSVVAYLDPGSGSMILQVLAGGVAAVGVAAKLYWRRLTRFLHVRKDEPEADTASEPEAP
jgi:hypothetical protein